MAGSSGKNPRRKILSPLKIISERAKVSPTCADINEEPYEAPDYRVAIEGNLLSQNRTI
jgi:hypothetical protein